MTPTAPDRPQPLFRRIRRAWADAPAVVQVLAVAAIYFGFLTLIDFAGWEEVASRCSSVPASRSCSAR